MDATECIALMQERVFLMKNWDPSSRKALKEAGKNQAERLAEAQERVRQVEISNPIGAKKAMGRAIMKIFTIGNWDDR